MTSLTERPYMESKDTVNYTNSQQFALDLFEDFLADANPYTVFLLRGYAGTGKTFLMRTITQRVRDLGMNVELMATTGRAAKTLSKAISHTASTIHRLIYRSETATIEEGGSFKLCPSREQDTLFVVDEASMISGESGEPTPFGSGNLLEDLFSYVWSGNCCKLILIGDSAQLPPVGSSLSDGLNADYLRHRFGLEVYQAELDNVVRQGQTSGILQCATALRNLLQEYEDVPEDAIIPIRIDIRGMNDVTLVQSDDLLDTTDIAYRRYGREECLIVCPSNKRAQQFNTGVRARILDYEEQLVRGERLIVARNNYHHTKRKDHSDFIANGEMIDVIRLRKHYEIYGLEFVDALIYLPDKDEEVEARLLLSGLSAETGQRTMAERQALFNLIAEDYAHISSITERRKAIRKDLFWGALEVKYGYAVTAHKAQGGQWTCIFVDLGLMNFLPRNKSMLRWLYTAVTRATTQLYFINAPKDVIIE